MAKRWRALHRRRLRPRNFCAEKGCGAKGYECWYAPWEKAEVLYCSTHAQQHGFCRGCGAFCAGIESFDFGPYHGFRDNCAWEIRAEEDREFYYDEDYFDEDYYDEPETWQY